MIFCIMAYNRKFYLKVKMKKEARKLDELMQIDRTLVADALIRSANRLRELAEEFSTFKLMEEDVKFLKGIDELIKKASM